MLNKLKSRFLKFYNQPAIVMIRKSGKAGVKHIENLQAALRRFFNDSGKYLAKMGLSANVVTIIGFLIGIFTINFLALEMYGTALLCILLNRVFDALDGAIARNSKITDFGVFLDATLDYIFYAGVIFGFALASPYNNAVPAAFLLLSFTASACALLAYAVVAYKNKPVQEIKLGMSPFYLGGVAQGFETFIALVIMCLLPRLFMPIAIILGVLSIVKALSIMVTAYYSFVIAPKNQK